MSGLTLQLPASLPELPSLQNLLSGRQGAHADVRGPSCTAACAYAWAECHSRFRPHAGPNLELPASLQGLRSPWSWLPINQGRIMFVRLASACGRAAHCMLCIPQAEDKQAQLAYTLILAVASFFARLQWAWLTEKPGVPVVLWHAG